MARLRRIGLVLLVLAVVVVGVGADARRHPDRRPPPQPARRRPEAAVALQRGATANRGRVPARLRRRRPGARRAVAARRGRRPTGSAGAMLLVLGVNNVGRNHPVVAAGGGRAWPAPAWRCSSRTRASCSEGRLEVGEVDGVVRAFELLAAPARGRSRSGSEWSASASAGRSPCWPRPTRASPTTSRFVNAFGAFADASTYLASVAAARLPRRTTVSEVPWTPSPLAREIYLRFMLDQCRRSRRSRGHSSGPSAATWSPPPGAPRRPGAAGVAPD